MANTEKIYLSVIQKELLTVLCDKELSGLQIIRAINEFRKVKSGRRWWCRVGFGSFYPALHSLEKKGLVVSRWENPSPGEARRKLYSVADLGLQALKST